AVDQVDEIDRAVVDVDAAAVSIAGVATGLARACDHRTRGAVAALGGVAVEGEVGDRDGAVDEISAATGGVEAGGTGGYAARALDLVVGEGDVREGDVAAEAEDAAAQGAGAVVDTVVGCQAAGDGEVLEDDVRVGRNLKDAIDALGVDGCLACAGA